MDKQPIVERALAVKCWDVKFNGVLLERFDRKRDAVAAAQAYKNLINRREQKNG